MLCSLSLHVTCAHVLRLTKPTINHVKRCGTRWFYVVSWTVHFSLPCCFSFAVSAFSQLPCNCHSPCHCSISLVLTGPVLIAILMIWAVCVAYPFVKKEITSRFCDDCFVYISLTSNIGIPLVIVSVANFLLWRRVAKSFRQHQKKVSFLKVGVLQYLNLFAGHRRSPLIRQGIGTFVRVATLRSNERPVDASENAFFRKTIDFGIRKALQKYVFCLKYFKRQNKIMEMRFLSF